MELEYIEYLERKIAEYEKVLDAMRRHADVSGRHVSVVAFAYRDNKDYKTIRNWLEGKE